MGWRTVSRNFARIEKDLALIRKAFKVDVEGNYERVIVRKFPLPSNWSRRNSDLLLVLPEDFPLRPPLFYLEKSLKLKFPDGSFGYFHSFNSGYPLWREGWGWLCSESEGWKGGWDPARDGLMSFLQKVEVMLPTAVADRTSAD